MVLDTVATPLHTPHTYYPTTHALNQRYSYPPYTKTPNLEFPLWDTSSLLFELKNSKSLKITSTTLGRQCVTMASHVSAQQILGNTTKSTRQPLKGFDVLDLEELKDLQQRKRAEFESYLKRNRLDLRQWIRYARFELEQRDMQRARSIFERCLIVDVNHIPTWIAYIDSELKNKYINHARNLMERSITILPRVDKLWYKYLFVEESLQEWHSVRSIYTKWISLEPNKNAWDSFVDFEIRQRNWDNVRDIFRKYLNLYPQLATWDKWIHFEKKFGSIQTVRKVYSLAMDTMLVLQKLLNNSNEIIRLCINFANWEISQHEFERTDKIYQMALELWPNNPKILQNRLNFQKSFDTKDNITNSVIESRKLKYEQHLSNEAHDYETWWIYLDLLEKYYPNDLLETYAEIITIIPNQIEHSISWERYICICLRYLCHLEVNLANIEKCRSFYAKLINEVIPHKSFTFNNVWLMFIEFEVRQGNLDKVDELINQSMDLCPNESLFKSYINLTMKLKNFNQLRNIFQNAIQFNPYDKSMWLQYANLEENLGELERCREIYQILSNDKIIKFDNSTKSFFVEKFIDFETNVQNFNNGKKVYDLLLRLSNFAVDIWIKFAMYNYSVPTDEQLEKLNNTQDDDDDDDDDDDENEFEPDETNFKLAQSIFERALTHFKVANDNVSRSQMLEALVEFVTNFGTEAEQELAKKRLPKINKKIELINGMEIESLQYTFPDDEISTEEKPKVSKLLAMAKKWKDDKNNQ